MDLSVISKKRGTLMPVNMRNLKDSRGRPHGLINSLPNSVPFKDFSNFPEKDRENMRKQRKESQKLVDVVYYNSRGPGECLEHTWSEWQGDNLDQFKFIHGEKYTISKGHLDYVNGSPELPKRSEILDASGTPTKIDGKGERLHTFFPASF